MPMCVPVHMFVYAVCVCSSMYLCLSVCLRIYVYVYIIAYCMCPSVSIGFPVCVHVFVYVFMCPCVVSVCLWVSLCGHSVKHKITKHFES